MLANQKCTKLVKFTWSWVVVVPTANKFVALANRVKGAVLAGQEYSFLLLCIFLRLFLCLIMELSSVLALSEDVLMLLLHNMDLLDLCVCVTNVYRG